MPISEPPGENGIARGSRWQVMSAEPEKGWNPRVCNVLGGTEDLELDFLQHIAGIDAALESAVQPQAGHSPHGLINQHAGRG